MTTGEGISIAKAITELLKTLPRREAGTEAMALWFDKKAEVFQRIADANTAESPKAKLMAAKARYDATACRAEASRG